MQKTSFFRALACVSLLFTSGCTTLSASGLFSHYSEVMGNSRQHVEMGEYDLALENLPNSPAGEVLDGFERGRLELLAGKNADSQNSFEISDAILVENSKQAMLRLSSGMNQAGSLLVNDSLIDYQPSDYELGFLHLYRSLNFLAQKDLTGALVEVRRANKVQENARKIREEELTEAESEATENGIDNQNLGVLLSRYPNAGAKLSEVQNGYLFYYSALLYEAEGNLNDAFIDYSRALAVAPKNVHIADALKRIARKQGRGSDLRSLEAKYGKFKKPGKDKGQVVILSEQNVVQSKKALRLPFSMWDENGQPANITVSLPYYPDLSVTPPRSIMLDGQSEKPLLLTNVSGMANAALGEQITSIAIRQIVRVLAKDRLRREISSHDTSGVANLLANVYNTVTEQADTRSWQTLPDSVGLFSDYIDAGKHNLDIGGQTVNIEVKPGRTTLVWLSRQGQNVVHWYGILGEL
ncbi:COG3014 family protein [Veronia pacifica]|uniref:Uncharacterized protein n=1 Tax=Veronia pacifica TaxID=1080227 RepID=A0A1C3EG52_9GAMM|nr:hypothetical protein [Veronia pacifica]ODA32201.1 hypothetical protein A8L45_14170 [Veronia pacifica]